MYKEPKSYKGFEKWWHEVQMSVKMYLYTFLGILLLHVMIPVFYFIFFDFETLKIVIEVFVNFHFHLWDKVLLLLLKEGFLIFILATPIWLLYPILLRRYKSYAESLMQDKYLRGSKFVSDDELRKIVLNDIKANRRF